MKTPDGRSRLAFFEDRQFWLALAAAPICWAGLFLLGMPIREQALPLLTLLLGMLLNPLLEEIVFRGGLQEWLYRRHALMRRRVDSAVLDWFRHRRRKPDTPDAADSAAELDGAMSGDSDWPKAQSSMSGGISLANLLTSLVFAAVHLLRQPPLWAALIFLPSLVFGWARDRHETLLSPILLHVCYNAGFIWLFAQSPGA